jgi:hypothetical protein
LKRAEYCFKMVTPCAIFGSSTISMAADVLGGVALESAYPHLSSKSEVAGGSRGGHG